MMRFCTFLIGSFFCFALASFIPSVEDRHICQSFASDKILGSSSLGLILDKSALKYSDEEILELLGYSGYKNYSQIPDTLKKVSGSKRHFINLCRADSSVWIFSNDLGKYLKCNAPINFKELEKFNLVLAIIDRDNEIGYSIYKNGIRSRSNYSLENWRVVREGIPLDFERPYLLAPTRIAWVEQYQREQLLYSIKENGVVTELDDQQMTTQLLHLTEQHFFGFYVSFEEEGVFKSWIRYVSP